MKGYIIEFVNDLVCVTNNPDKWLKENNKQRLEDGEEAESLDIFTITEIGLAIYGDEE